MRLYPVGRLDYLSEGLLLMTNDGELANSLSKAAAGVEKTYLVKIAGVPAGAGMDQIRRGIMIDRGRLDEVRAGRRDRIMTAPGEGRTGAWRRQPWYQLTLTEGRNRQIRKMFEEIGHHVEKIRRIGYGALRLDVAAGRVPRADAGRGDGAGAVPRRARRSSRRRRRRSLRSSRRRLKAKACAAAPDLRVEGQAQPPLQLIPFLKDFCPQSLQSATLISGVADCGFCAVLRVFFHVGRSQHKWVLLALSLG